MNRNCRFRNRWSINHLSIKHAQIPVILRKSGSLPFCVLLFFLTANLLKWLKTNGTFSKSVSPMDHRQNFTLPDKASVTAITPPVLAGKGIYPGTASHPCVSCLILGGHFVLKIHFFSCLLSRQFFRAILASFPEYNMFQCGSPIGLIYDIRKGKCMIFREAEEKDWTGWSF